MSQLDQKQVLEILAPIRNREFGGESIVALGQVADIRICRPIVSVTVTLPNVGSEVGGEIRDQVREALLRLPEIERAEVAIRTQVSSSPTSRVGQDPGPPSGVPGPRAPMPDPTKPEGVQNVVAIASGKGGVGKSTVSANLAVALAADGARVGLLDADVYGPSQTTMFGMDDRPATDEHRRLIPLEAHGVRFISMGMLSSKETPVIWRGPMASRLVQQFFSGVVWGELDYLLVDLPPGTGDVQLTIAQTAALAGAVIVTTPQAVARTIAEKGLRMFQPVRVPVLGVIENMSSFACPHCGERTNIFSTGGGEEVAGDLGLPFLGGVPLDPRVVLAGDEGTPTVVRDSRESRRRRLSGDCPPGRTRGGAVQPGRTGRSRRFGNRGKRRGGGALARRLGRPFRVRIPAEPLPVRHLRGRMEREAPVVDPVAADQLRAPEARSRRELRRSDPLE